VARDLGCPAVCVRHRRILANLVIFVGGLAILGASLSLGGRHTSVATAVLLGGGMFVSATGGTMRIHLAIAADQPGPISSPAFLKRFYAVFLTALLVFIVAAASTISLEDPWDFLALAMCVVGAGLLVEWVLLGVRNHSLVDGATEG